MQWYESWLQNSMYTCSAQSVFLTRSTESVIYRTEPIFIMEINDDGHEGPTKLTKNNDYGHSIHGRTSDKPLQTQRSK